MQMTLAKTLTLAGCLCVSVGVGCRSIDNPVRPSSLLSLDAKSPSNAPPLDNRYNERLVCIKTAKTVAEKGYSGEAIQLYEKAEKLDASEPALDLELAPLYAESGQSEKAIARYRKVIAAGNAAADVYNNLAWTLLENGLHNDALQTCQQGLARWADDKRLQTTNAVTHYHLGNRDQSLEAFTSLYGTSAAHHNLAILDTDAGNLDMALRHAVAAAELPNCATESIELRDSLRTQIASIQSQTLKR